jgi:hypothetical protein
VRARRTERLAALAALAFAAAACAGGAPGDADPIPPWARRPPPGCAVGLSGPTLEPGDALRRARRGAREALAEHVLPMRVESAWRDGRRPRERTRHTTRGNLRGARVVALRAQSDRLWALACLPGAAGPARRGPVAPPPYPDWVLDVPSGRRCELGVGGPTRDPADRARRALADGRRALAEAGELRVRRQVLDDGRGAARVRADSSASDAAAARAAARAVLEQTWTDARGRGPQRRPDVLYARGGISPA